MKTLTVIILLILSKWFGSKVIKKVTQPTLLIDPIQSNNSIELTEIETKESAPSIETIEVIKVVEKDMKLNIKEELLPREQYIGKRNKPICMLVLHHTQGSSFEGCLSHWKETPERVGVGYIIDKDGTIIQALEDDTWAYQLGIRVKDNNINEKYKTKEHSDFIEQSAIGIELVCEGELIKKPEGYYFENGNRYIENDKVIRLEKCYKGYWDYVKYTEAQINSLKLLINFLCDKHNIKKEWDSNFNISEKGFNFVSGIYSHVNFRSCDKTDIYPYKPLINMLKDLKNIK